MLTETRWLPLFPLNTVLFPDGVLPLKVFEPRFIDMVRDCMKEEHPFGIIRINSGNEVGGLPQIDHVGCVANIANWDMQELGVLLIQVIGGARFRILETRELAGPRLEARVAIIDPDAPQPATPMLLACARALKSVIDDINARQYHEQDKDFVNPFPATTHFDDSAWVANRWCEILPIPSSARQKLLELDNAASRLAIIHQYLQQHKIL
ncbi:MAG: LON peptidase substrate-binding domain-containing protein [Janthinobacterium lividum]